LRSLSICNVIYPTILAGGELESFIKRGILKKTGLAFDNPCGDRVFAEESPSHSEMLHRDWCAVSSQVVVSAVMETRIAGVPHSQVERVHWYNSLGA
jgi:hypothetical protein